MEIEVVALPFPLRDGDWHDRPLRWKVQGPGNEVQNFVTKKDALRYRSIRKRSFSFTEAVKAYCQL